MSIELPTPIAAYFRSDSLADAWALSACFTEGAVVIDEGNSYTGRNAIRQWMATASTTYTYKVEPFALSEEGERTVVTSRLEGTFPGSPVNLRYIFTLADDKIARLEILP